MAARGVLFAIDAPTAGRLRAARGDDDAILEIIEEVEEAWDRPFLVETDKAWDAMHRALTDGSLSYGDASDPLGAVVLYGDQLYEGDDYVAVLKEPEQVRAAAAAAASIDDVAMDDRYRTMVPAEYGPEYGDEDRRYTVESFADVRDFYRRAADAGRSVLFTVDR